MPPSLPAVRDARPGTVAAAGTAERRCARRRPGLAGLSLLLLLLGGTLAADDAPQTPPDDAPPKPTLQVRKLEEMEVPPAEHFLDPDPNSARDWVVLKNGTVIVTLPLSPRPNTLALREQQIQEHQAARRGLSGEKLETWRRELEKLRFLDVSIPELEPEPEYRLPLDQIDRIIHHEDQWLMRIDRLIAERNIEASLELLGVLQQRRPDWPGIQARTEDLIFADADVRLAAGKTEEALMLFEEVARRRPNYPGLAEKAGAAVDRQIAAAMAAGDYRQARVFLSRLNQIVPGTPVFQKYTAELAQRAANAAARAKELFSAGQLAEAVSAVEEAVRIWPDTPGLPSTYKSIGDRYQRVRVGVTRLAEQPTAYPFETEADERHRRLTQIPLFEIASFSGGSARYRTRFFDEWMPSNLGRTMRFTLRQTRQPWEMQPTLLGWPITEQLARRLDPSSPRFDERFSGYVQSMTVESPFEFVISFRRVPPRLEALLTEPIVAAPQQRPSAGGEALDPAGESDAADPPLPAGGFELVERTESQALYRRHIPEPDRQRIYHVAEVVERRYSDPEAAVTALQQGEIDVLPTPPVWIVRRLLSDEVLKSAFFIQQHAIPETHVLLFNPQQPVLRSRELRRALIYASNRLGILEDVLLRQPGGSQGRVVAGPFPSNSRANAAGVTPRPYDPYAGFALALAARNSLTAAKVISGDLPRLRLLAPPDPLLRQAAQRLVADWGVIGINAELIPDDDLTAYAEGRWDLIYRRVQMTEPVVQLWPFLTLQPTARIADLAPFPDWLKQEIIALDRAADFIRAEERVKTLHRHLTDEATLIPLWEVDQYTIYRKNLRGFPVSPVYCYDNVDAWIREATLEPAGSSLAALSGGVAP